MRRHDLDWLSLLGGLFFLGAAIAYTIGAYVDLHLDGRVVWALGLIALGAVGIGAAVTAGRREEAAYAVDTGERAPEDPLS